MEENKNLTEEVEETTAEDVADKKKKKKDPKAELLLEIEALKAEIKEKDDNGTAR